LRGELIENFQEILPGLFQESEVVEGAAAADVVGRDLDRESRGLQDPGGGVERLGAVVVVPRVRKQD
jgi:hypothetical protein